MAEQLKPLSRYGWVILAAQGESTRTLREFLANDGTDRPILGLTDADFYGTGIIETLSGESERTKHLDFSALEPRVVDLGLTPADAEALDLPDEADPTKSPDDRRTELDALAVLSTRHGIDAPLLAYAVAKMCALGIPVCRRPVDDPAETVRGAMRRRLRDAIFDAVDDVVEESIENALDGVDVTALDSDGDGDLIRLQDGSAPPSGANVTIPDEFRDDLAERAATHLDSLRWERQSAAETRVIGRVTDPGAVEEIAGRLPGDGDE